MKKLFAICIALGYLFTSSTLVHSFCVQQHLLDVVPQHGCCEETEDSSNDCYDHCLSNYKDTLNPSLTPKVKDVGNVGVEIFQSFEITLDNQSVCKYTTETISDPPRLEKYIGITKKIE